MIPVPWKYVESWNCLACGRCCKGYDVALRFNEWVNIIRTYGAEFTEPRIDKLCLRKKYDGTCVFLYNFLDRWWLCGLQHMKPNACKLWPFKILGEPRYGRPQEASFTMREKTFFIYVDPQCMGIRWGAPTQEFTQKTLPEFVEIGLGLRERQKFSTSKMPYQPLYIKTEEENRLRKVFRYV